MPDAAGDVAAGRAIAAGNRWPPLRFTPDRYAAQRYAGASGDFTPFHLDAELARAIGLPGIILHGLYTYGQLARGLLEPFEGDPRALQILAARFRRPAVPEAELALPGRVEEAGEDRIRSPARSSRADGRCSRRGSPSSRRSGAGADSARKADRIRATAPAL